MKKGSEMRVKGQYMEKEEGFITATTTDLHVLVLRRLHLQSLPALQLFFLLILF